MINYMGKTIQAQQVLPGRAINPDHLLGAELATGKMTATDLADFCRQVNPDHPVHKVGELYLCKINEHQLAGWIGQRIGREGLRHGGTISLTDMVALVSRIDHQAADLKMVLDRQRLAVLEQMKGWPELADRTEHILADFEEFIHLDYHESSRSSQLKEVADKISTLAMVTEEAPWDLYRLSDNGSVMAKQSIVIIEGAGEDIYMRNTPLEALDALLYRDDSSAPSYPHDSRMLSMMYDIFMIRLRTKALDGQGQIITGDDQNEFEVKIGEAAQEVRKEMVTMTEGFVDEALTALIPKP